VGTHEAPYERLDGSGLARTRLTADKGVHAASVEPQVITEVVDQIVASDHLAQMGGHPAFDVSGVGGLLDMIVIS